MPPIDLLPSPPPSPTPLPLPPPPDLTFDDDEWKWLSKLTWCTFLLLLLLVKVLVNFVCVISTIYSRNIHLKFAWTHRDYNRNTGGSQTDERMGGRTDGRINVHLTNKCNNVSLSRYTNQGKLFIQTFKGYICILTALLHVILDESIYIYIHMYYRRKRLIGMSIFIQTFHSGGYRKSRNNSNTF